MTITTDRVLDNGFIRLRTHPHAQAEIQAYARIVRDIALLVAPASTNALLGNNV